MRAFFKRLFERPDALTRLARSGDAAAFASLFRDASVHALALTEPDGIDANGLTQEQVLAQLESAAQKISDAVEPFTYSRDGACCLPVFTDQKLMEIFCGEYSMARNRVFAFQGLTLKGSVLIPAMRAAERTILNAETRFEVVLSKAQCDAILK